MMTKEDFTKMRSMGLNGEGRLLIDIAESSDGDPDARGVSGGAGLSGVRIPEFKGDRDAGGLAAAGM